MKTIISVTPKQAKALQVSKQIKYLITQIEKEALSKIECALNCGAIGEDSIFMEDNFLLANAIIKIVSVNYFYGTTKQIKKEYENLRMMI